MATRKSIKFTYNADKLFEEFKSYLTLTKEEVAELNQLIEDLPTLQKQFDEVSEKFTQLKDSLHKDLISQIEIELSEFSENVELVKKLVRRNDLISKFENGSISEEEKKEMLDLDSELKPKKEQIKSFAEKYKSISNMQAIIEEFERLLTIADVDELYEEVKSEIDDENIKSSYETARTEYDAIKNAKNNAETRIDELQTKQANANLTVENFENFLRKNKLSTVHAEEILNYLVSGTNLEMKKDDIKIRKTHPKRDAVVKKGMIPTAITSGAVGALVAAITKSGLTAGSKIANLLPVMSSKVLTISASATLGLVVGLIATPVIFYAKNKLTKLHYSVWYKSAKHNLKEYESGTELEDLPISKLITKIEKTKHEILELNNGNWLTRKLKFIPKHILNAVNRNRIHHVEAYTKDLVKIFESRKKSGKNVDSIYDLMLSVDKFIDKDVFESKLNAMLTCKDSKKHTHTSTIENIDIFANLKNALNHASTKNLRNKKTVAHNILNNGANLSSILGARPVSIDANNDADEVLTSDDELDLNLDADTIILTDDSLDVNDTSDDLNSDIINPDVNPEVILDDNNDVNPDENNADPDVKPQSRERQPQVDEKTTTRRIILDRLQNDETFTEQLREAGHKQKTINNLIKKLSQAIEEGKRTVVTRKSPKTLDLYFDTIAKINDETSSADDVLSIAD